MGNRSMTNHIMLGNSPITPWHGLKTNSIDNRKGAFKSTQYGFLPASVWWVQSEAEI